MKRQGFPVTRHQSALRPGPDAIAAVCMLLVAGACAQGTKEPASDSLAAEVARLGRSTALLERRLDLAGGKEFYLVLDPAAPDLTLMLRGAELRRFAVLGLQIGYPRISWSERRDPRTWQGVTWANGELDPPRPTDRIVVMAEPVGKGKAEPEPPPIPPTAEELYRVPPRFHVRFSGGLSVEIRPREADASVGRLAWLRAWWSAKWGDVVAATGSRNRDVVRLRVVLSRNDAESLYRSLPPSVQLLVLMGGPAAGRASKTGGTPAPGTR